MKITQVDFFFFGMIGKIVKIIDYIMHSTYITELLTNPLKECGEPQLCQVQRFPE